MNLLIKSFYKGLNYKIPSNEKIFILFRFHSYSINKAGLMEVLWSQNGLGMDSYIRSSIEISFQFFLLGYL
jgi:hypothetical protein